LLNPHAPVVARRIPRAVGGARTYLLTARDLHGSRLSTAVRAATIEIMNETIEIVVRAALIDSSEFHRSIIDCSGAGSDTSRADALCMRTSPNLRQFALSA
jgi:hypothetical protein